MLQSTVSMDMPCGSVELCIHINRDILTDFWTTSTSLVYLQAFFIVLERKNTMKVENQKTIRIVLDYFPILMCKSLNSVLK